MKLSERAEKFVMAYEKKEGRHPEFVNRKDKQNHKGYDIVSKNDKGEIVRKIEVKGSKTDGIPDCFETELTSDGKLVGTHLYLVRFVNAQKRLFIVTRKDFNKYTHKPVTHWKLSSQLRTSLESNYRVK